MGFLLRFSSTGCARVCFESHSARCKTNGVSGTKFELTLRNIPRKLYKFHFRSVSSKVCRTYPRDVARSATPRGLPRLPREGVRRARPHAGPLVGRLRARSAPAEKRCFSYSSPPYARPAGRSRPPSAAVQRRKLFPARTAKNKLNWSNSIKYLPALASGAPRIARGAGLFYISI